MSRDSMTSRVEGDRTLVLERTFDAPQSVLFKIYTTEEHLKNWWGPKGWDVPYCKVDLRVGGVWHYCMKCVDKSQGEYYGMESWGKAIYKKIESPKRLDYTDYFSDEKGTENPNMPSTDCHVEFVPMGEKTKLVTRAQYATPEALKSVMDMGMMEGIAQTWDRLDEYLQTRR